MATGVSIRGVQNLVTVGQAGSGFFSVRMVNTPLPVIQRLGYFYLYQYRNVTPFPHYVIDDGWLRAPGEWRKITVPLFDANHRYRLDVKWEIPGLSWDAQTF